MRRSRFLVPFAALLALAVAVPLFLGAESSAQPEADVAALTDPAPSASAELRVWQSVRAPHGLWVSARPGPDSRWTTRELNVAMLEGGGWRAASHTVDALDGELDLRVWQHPGDPGLVYLGARPAGGSWNEYGTRRLELDGVSRSGRFRYAHLEVALAWPDAEPPEPGTDAVALCIPDGLETGSLRARVWRSVAAPHRYWISARPAGDDARWTTREVTLAESGEEGWNAGGLTVDAGAAVFELRLWERGSAVHLSARVAATPWDEFGTRPLDLGQLSPSGRTAYADLDIELTLPEPDPPLPGEERTWQCPAEEPEPETTPEPANEPPQADAGDRQTVNAGDTVTLDGTGSADPDGDELAFAWTGPADVSLTGADTATPSFTATAAHAGRTLTFRLTVTDTGGLSASDTVEVEVRPPPSPVIAPQPTPNRPPTADAGDDATVERTKKATLDGSGSSDPEGATLTYAWSQTAGTDVTLSSTSVVKPTFTVPQTAAIGAAYTFTLTVSDGALSATDTVTITAANAPPTANAGADAKVNRTVEATLDGSGSNDPDGSTLTYAWSQTAGTTVTLSSTSVVKPTFTVPTAATTNEQLTFSLTVTDTDSATATDTVTITAANAPPIADAGANETVNRTEKATLDGSGSNDPEGSTLTYVWSQTHGTTVTLSDATAKQPTFAVPQTAAIGDAFTFSLTVTDVDKDTDTDTVTIRAANAPPVADAGADATVNRTTTATLDGRRSGDPEDSTLIYAWSQTAGTTVTLSSTTVVRPTFTVPAGAGVNEQLAFSLTVTDADSATDTDTVTITAANVPPDADAGEDATVDPEANVVLDGSGSSDPEDSTLTFAWAKTGGTYTGLVPVDTGTSVSFNVPYEAAAGQTIVMRLTVTDENGGSGALTDTDDVTFTVSNANRRPSVTLADATAKPGDALSLSATVDDPDGDNDEITYLWATDAPTSLLTGETTATPTFTVPTSDTKGKAYTITLTVTDEDDATDSDSMTVTVSNTAPTADAGDNQSVDRNTTATLDGSGSSDPDTGDTLTYAWTQTAGTTVTLSSTTVASPTFTVPVAASVNEQLRFSLTVSDGANSDTDTVIVKALNALPTANAGDDKTAAAGTKVSPSGSGSDPDGDDTKITFQWSTIDVPPSLLERGDTATPTLEIPAGHDTDITLTLTVMDEDGATATDEMTVTVTN